MDLRARCARGSRRCLRRCVTARTVPCGPKNSKQSRAAALSAARRGYSLHRDGPSIFRKDFFSRRVCGAPGNAPANDFPAEFLSDASRSSEDKTRHAGHEHAADAQDAGGLRLAHGRGRARGAPRVDARVAARRAVGARRVPRMRESSRVVDISAKYPRGSRGGAATRPRTIHVLTKRRALVMVRRSQPNVPDDSFPRTIRVGSRGVAATRLWKIRAANVHLDGGDAMRVVLVGAGVLPAVVLERDELARLGFVHVACDASMRGARCGRGTRLGRKSRMRHIVVSCRGGNAAVTH